MQSHVKVSDQANMSDYILSNWSRNIVGDIHAQVKEFEEKVRFAIEELLNMESDANMIRLHAVNAKYIKFHKIEAFILKQKSQVH